MKISIEKKEVMTVSWQHQTLYINIHGHQLKQIGEFKYLGSMFTEDGKLDREIETRIQKANQVVYQLTPLLQNRAIGMSTKRQLINAIFIPTLCFQCQSWTLTKRHVRKITTCEMRCLRKAANKTRRDRIRNETIRRMVGTVPVIDYINKQRIRWFGHIIRMPPQQPDETATKPEESRKSDELMT